LLQLPTSLSVACVRGIRTSVSVRTILAKCPDAADIRRLRR